jgi:hypothetical protein
VLLIWLGSTHLFNQAQDCLPVRNGNPCAGFLAWFCWERNDDTDEAWFVWLEAANDFEAIDQSHHQVAREIVRERTGLNSIPWKKSNQGKIFTNYFVDRIKDTNRMIHLDFSSWDFRTRGKNLTQLNPWE